MERSATSSSREGDPWADGGPATQAPLLGPHQLALDSHSHILYFADPLFGVPAGFIRRVDLKTGIISTVKIGVSAPIGVALDRAGNLYVANTRANIVQRVDLDTGAVSTVAGVVSAGYSGDGGPATEAKLNSPTYLALNAAGDLFFTDGFNYSVRMIDFDRCRDHRKDDHGKND